MALKLGAPFKSKVPADMVKEDTLATHHQVERAVACAESRPWDDQAVSC